MRFIIFSFLMLSSLQSHAIINGFEISEDEYPQIGILEKQSQICTVTLVGKRAVLTAGHCAREISNPTIRFGHEIYSVKFKHHPKLDKSYWPNVPDSFAVKNDTALGVLDRDVQNVKPISVSESRPELNEILFVAGAGKPKVGVRQFALMRTIKIGDSGLTLSGNLSTSQGPSEGDSGGGTFRTDQDGNTIIIAVNSAATGDRDGTSEFGKVFGAPMILGSAILDFNFLNQAATKLGVEVCGLNIKCSPIKFKAMR